MLAGGSPLGQTRRTIHDPCSEGGAIRKPGARITKPGRRQCKAAGQNTIKSEQNKTHEIQTKSWRGTYGVIKRPPALGESIV